MQTGVAVIGAGRIASALASAFLSRFLRRHPHLAVLLDRPYDCPDEGVQLLPSSSPAHLDDFGRKIIRRHDSSMDGVFEIVCTVGDPVGPADDVALDGQRRWP